MQKAIRPVVMAIMLQGDLLSEFDHQAIDGGHTSLVGNKNDLMTSGKQKQYSAFRD